MIRTKDFTISDINDMFEAICGSTNIGSIREIVDHCEENVLKYCNLVPTPNLPLCTTVISTESAFGLKDMVFTTKFTNQEIRDSTGLVDGIIKRNEKPYQKEVVNYLRILYNTLLDLAALGMSQIHTFDKLRKYRYLFFYYKSKVGFMLREYGEFMEEMKLFNNHTKFQEQISRIQQMELRRMMVCGIFILPVAVIASYTACCWTPCYFMCKIHTTDDLITNERIRRIHDNHNYW